MKSVQLDRDIQPLSAFRANAAAVLKRVRETRQPVVLTQRGHSSAVVLDVTEYERIMAELELLRDVHAAEQQLARGEEVGRRLLDPDEVD